MLAIVGRHHPRRGRARLRRQRHPARRQSRQVRARRRRRQLQGRHRRPRAADHRRGRHRRLDRRGPGPRIRRLSRPGRDRALARRALRGPRHRGVGRWSCRSPPSRRPPWPAPRWRLAGPLAAPTAAAVAGRRGRPAGHRRAEQRGRGRAVRAHRIARPRDRDRARVQSGHRADAGGDLVPGRRATGHPDGRARAHRHTSPTSRTTLPIASRSSPPGSRPPSPPAHGARRPARSDPRATGPGIRSPRVPGPARWLRQPVSRTTGHRARRRPLPCR